MSGHCRDSQWSQRKSKLGFLTPAPFNGYESMELLVRHSFWETTRWHNPCHVFAYLLSFYQIFLVHAHALKNFVGQCKL